jgi:hypothetical protein
LEIKNCRDTSYDSDIPKQRSSSLIERALQNPLNTNTNKSEVLSFLINVCREYSKHPIKSVYQIESVKKILDPSFQKKFLTWEPEQKKQRLQALFSDLEKWKKKCQNSKKYSVILFKYQDLNREISNPRNYYEIIEHKSTFQDDSKTRNDKTGPDFQKNIFTYLDDKNFFEHLGHYLYWQNQDNKWVSLIAQARPRL